MIYYRVAIGPAILFLPVVMAVHLVFTIAVSLTLAMANLYYRDVKYIFEVAIAVWMFATSVVYPVQMVGGRLGALLALNPMTPIIDVYRSTLLLGRLPAPGQFGAVSVVAVLALAVAWLLFHRGEFQFAENV